MRRWLKRIAATLAILLLLTLLALGWLIGSESGNRRLLGALPVAGLQIGAFEGLLLSRFTLDDLRYDDGLIRLGIDRLTLAWDVWALLDGRLHIQAIDLGEVRFASLQPAPGDQAEETTAALPQLPLAIRLERARIAAITLETADGEQRISDLHAALSSQAQRIELTTFSAGYSGIRLDAKGHLNLHGQLPLALQLSWQGILPELGESAGEGRIEGDLTRLGLNHRLQRPLQLTTEGEVRLDRDEPLLDLQGGWQGLVWPLAEGAPADQSPDTATRFSSREGRYRLNGPLSRLHLMLAGDLAAASPDIPPLKVRLDTDILATGLQQIQASIQLLQGEAQVTGRFDWSPLPAWDMRIRAERIDPAGQWPEWPGELAFTAGSSGELREGVPQLSGHIEQLSGQLRGYPVRASGRFDYRDGRLDLERIEALSGSNRLELQGHWAERLDLRFTLAAPALEQIAPQLSGQVKARGRVQGSVDDPRIDLQAGITDLGVQEHRLPEAEAEISWNREHARIRLHARRPQIAGWQGEMIELTLDGTPESHRIAASLSDTQGRLQGELSGGWQAPLWRGQLLDLQGRHPWTGAWQSQQPSDLQVGAERFSLERLCLLLQDPPSGERPARICTRASWQSGETDISGEISALPLTLLARWLPEQTRAEGSLDGSLRLQQDRDVLNGDLLLTLERAAFEMDLAQQEPLRLELHTGQIETRIEDDRITSRLQLAIDQSGTIEGQAQLAPPDSDLVRPLSGRLQLQLADLRPLQVLLPQQFGLDGRLQGDLQLSGSLAAPGLQGGISLREGKANVPELGIELSAIRLEVTTDDLNNADIQGSLNSGDGSLSLAGELALDPARGWPLRLNITGEQFQLVRLPEAVAEISPRLDIRLQQQRLEVRGRIDLPEAQIRVKELPSGSVGVSEDQVLIGQPATAASAQPPLTIDAEIGLHLGDAVHFEGFGLKTGITGSLDLSSRDGHNLGQGELSLVEGRYKAYGQDLTIEKGRLLFAGPLENPGLDLQATRLSVDQSVTAVLDVGGTLRKPLVSIGSRPSLPEEEALAYLVSGRGLGEEGPGRASMLRQAAFAQGLEKSQALLDAIASGIGADTLSVQEGGSLEESALVLGKYLSPDLYISYGVGLFDAANALKLRYRMTEQLRLEAESGSQQSVDLIYQIERE